METGERNKPLTPTTNTLRTQNYKRTTDLRYQVFYQTLFRTRDMGATLERKRRRDLREEREKTQIQGRDPATARDGGHQNRFSHESVF
ncbi:unnamed protein product [Eruca vesicaria subsp. sativa]|uniref:Uncharacterized protein n=1 Tax=Eruca vesicaria subsp. sativa TaxID=29727 RepID=A0ABC8KXC9_ERUVS|nr:unnamed protein product [Eruca vesicaria subsp. sativa]